MFKIALVVPSPPLVLASDCSPPLGLAYLASYVMANVPNIEIKIIDGVTGQVPAQEISNFKPDIVGITATTPLVVAAYQLADELKAQTNLTVVLGGPHVSVMSDEALAHGDYVVVGEGEQAFDNIIKEVMANGKPEKPKIVKGTSIESLDEIPSPAYNLLNMQFYLSRRFLEPLMKPPVLGLVTSRGCPYRCAFCYNFGRSSKVRYFSAKRVVDDLLLLHDKYGVSNFFFQDDEFLINHQRLKELATLFKAYDIDKWIKWGCQARVTTLNKDLLSLAETIGCVLIVPGMESHNPRMLSYLKSGSVKQCDLDRAVKLFEDSKITLFGNFVVGTPSETIEEMWDSVKFFVHSPTLISMIVNVLTPYPGTKVWSDCQEAGLLPEKVDYSTLVPTREGGFNVCTAKPEDFNKFLKHVDRVTFVFRTVRFKPSLGSFFGLWRAKTWWWMWLAHPDFMLTLLKQCWHHNK
jgi:anaerobic magnesium-protoporphyrin IX monomethyl ester cyclase